MSERLVGRRHCMQALAGASTLLLAAPAPGAYPSYDDLEGDALARAFMTHAERLRQRAVDEGDQPYGAVVVRGKTVVGEGPSRVVTNQDPTAHAEVEAIRDAARRLARNDLGDCLLYATSSPCRMCETAAYWARIAGVFVGPALRDQGAPGYGSC